MLQKFKITSRAFIYLFMIGFSFVALQVTAEEVEVAPFRTKPNYPQIELVRFFSIFNALFLCYTDFSFSSHHRYG